MSLSLSGINSKTQSDQVLVKIVEEHPLIQLANALPWQEMADLILPDLKQTAAGKWHLGRKLEIRVHLGVYLLQQLHNYTDRQTEYHVKDNAAYQLFTGRFIVDSWHAPDHTKIETFRSRLSAETQKKLANLLAANAVTLGFGNPSDVDIDSTIQEANMAYPADSSLLKKLGSLSNKIAKFIGTFFTEQLVEPLKVNMKEVSTKARSYFFLPKKSTQEVRNEKLMDLLKVVEKEVSPVIHMCDNLDEDIIEKMPWNQQRTIRQIKELAKQYMQDVKTWIVTGIMVPTKILSFHIKEAVCFTKGKPGRKYHFGRAFQLGRIMGNFVFVTKCTSPQMPDKKSIKPMIQEHENIFNTTTLNSVSTDKGYYSINNEKHLVKKGVNEIAIQRPGNIKKAHPKPITPECEEKLVNRRSGIEPIIGHIKQGGQLGRSRMKSDKSIESSGYTAVLGFNMRQLIRHQQGKYAQKVA